MIKKWGNCEPKSGCFRGHFPLHFFDSMTAFVNGFSFEGDVLICQDLTKPNPVYWGHYFSDLFSAQKDLVARAQEEVQCLEEQRQNTIVPESPFLLPMGQYPGM